MTLSLKYRPKTFNELIGQDAISRALSLTLQKNRVSNAYLFSGLRGSGKTSSARIFARALLCEKFPAQNPCNECPSCIQALGGRHIDIVELDAASSRKIDDIRELIEQTKYAPATGKFKVFIIDEVHMLTKEAFNAFLKTLEEPPSYVKFILATTDVLKLPSTILSRTLHFSFKKVGQKILENHIAKILESEGIEYESECLPLIARSGDGSVRDTLSMLDMTISYCNFNLTYPQVAEMLNTLDNAILDELFNALDSKNRPKILELVDELSKYDADNVLDAMMDYLYTNLDKFEKKILILERYLKIIANAKSLLSLGVLGNFNILLLALKMLEAQKLGLIEDEIQALESGKSQAQITAPAKSQSGRFDALISKLYDRNFELGKNFEENVGFVELKDKELILKSLSTSKENLIIRSNWQTIKLFAQEIFGIGIAIKFEKKQEEETKAKLDIQPNQASEPNQSNMLDSGSAQIEKKENKKLEIKIEPKGYIAPIEMRKVINPDEAPFDLESENSKADSKTSLQTDSRDRFENENKELLDAMRANLPLKDGYTKL